MGSLLHGADVVWVGIATLAVLDWIGKAIGELSLRTEEVGLHKVNHSVVCEGEGQGEGQREEKMKESASE